MLLTNKPGRPGLIIDGGIVCMLDTPCAFICVRNGIWWHLYISTKNTSKNDIGT